MNINCINITSESDIFVVEDERLYATEEYLKKNSVERGMIIAGADFEQDNGCLKMREHNALAIRTSVLYSSHILIPVPEGFMPITGKYINELLDKEIARFLKIRLESPQSIQLGEAINFAQEIAYRELNKLPGHAGNWTMYRNSENRFPRIHNEPKLANALVEFNLFNTLPTPPEDIPIDELISFKQENKLYFSRFQVALDELFRNVIANGTAAELKRARLDLDEAIADMKKCSKKPFKGKFLAKARIDYTALIQSLVAFGFSPYFPYEALRSLGLVCCAIYGATKGLKDIDIKVGEDALNARIQDKHKPYRIFYEMEKRFPGTLHQK